jgi:hypothetical protein
MKKAEISTSTMIGMLALIVILVVMISMSLQISENADRGYNNELCRTSVVANSKLNTPLFGDGTWPIQCPTRYHFFDMEGFVEESGDYKQQVVYTTKRSKVTSDNSEYYNCMNDNSIKREGKLTKDEVCVLRNINMIIAKRHAECWEQFGRGELALFDRLNTERQCVICSVFDFSEKLENKMGEYYSSEILDEKNTLDYMMRTKGPRGRDITYYELSEDPLDVFDQPYYDYAFSESYVSVFIANNDNYVQTKLQKLGQVFTDPIHTFLPFIKTGPEGQEQFFLNTVEYSPESIVVKECDILVEQ